MRGARLLVLLCLVFFVSAMAAVSADDMVVLHDSPVAVFVNRVTERDAVDYIRSLSENLEVGGTTLSLYDVASQYMIKSQVERPINGSLMFLTKGLIPSVSMIRFSQLENEAEYDKRIAEQKRIAGKSVAIEGGDGKHRMETTMRTRMPIPDAPVSSDGVQQSSFETPQASEQSIMIGFGGAGSTIQFHDLSNSEIIEENGKKFRQTTFTSQQYMRYCDQLMYSGDAKAVWDANLLSLDGIRNEVRGDIDLGVEVYFDRVPVGLKTMGWNMLSAGLGTQMQQRDGESDYDYRLRNTSGNLALMIAKAAIFDARRVHSTLRLADDDLPVRGELSLDVEENCGLAKQFADLSSSDSRFAPIVRDGAAVTLHTAVRLPKESEEVIRSGVDWLQNYLIHEAGADADLVLGGMEVAATLSQIADHNNLELFLKLGWSEPSGSVIYGGLQVDDNPKLLKGLLALLTPEAASEEFAGRFTMTKKGDLEFIQFLVPFDAFGPDSPVHLTHAYIVHANSCLWFCIGGEKSYQILQTSIDRCQEAGMLINTRVLTAEIDMEKWMSYPSDDETGLAMLPVVFDRAMISELLDRPDFGEISEAVEVTTSPYREVSMQRIREFGGQQTAQLHIDISKSGFHVTTEIGKAFGNYFLVRWLQMMDDATASIDLDELQQSIDIQQSDK